MKYNIKHKQRYSFGPPKKIQMIFLVQYLAVYGTLLTTIEV